MHLALSGLKSQCNGDLLLIAAVFAGGVGVAVYHLAVEVGPKCPLSKQEGTDAPSQGKPSLVGYGGRISALQAGGCRAITGEHLLLPHLSAPKKSLTAFSSQIA